MGSFGRSGFVDRVGEDRWWRVALVAVGPLLRLLLRVRIAGLEHVPASGGGLVAANHVSVLDPIVIALGTSARGRTIRFLAGAEFFEPQRPLVSWALRRLRQVPVRRRMRDRAALEEVASIVRKGALAGIFPEGRMGEGPLQRGRTGVGRIALAAGAPVVPAAVWGTQTRWPRTGFRWGGPLRPAVAVVFGPPIHPAGPSEPGDDARELTDRVMREIASLLAKAQRVAGS